MRMWTRAAWKAGVVVAVAVFFACVEGACSPGPAECDNHGSCSSDNSTCECDQGYANSPAGSNNCIFNPFDPPPVNYTLQAELVGKWWGDGESCSSSTSEFNCGTWIPRGLKCYPNGTQSWPSTFTANTSHFTLTNLINRQGLELDFETVQPSDGGFNLMFGTFKHADKSVTLSALCFKREGDLLKIVLNCNAESFFSCGGSPSSLSELDCSGHAQCPTIWRMQRGTPPPTPAPTPSPTPPPPTPSPTPAPTAAPSVVVPVDGAGQVQDTPPDTTSEGFPGGAIAAVVIGSIVFVGLLIVLVFQIRSLRRIKKAERDRVSLELETQSTASTDAFIVS